MRRVASVAALQALLGVGRLALWAVVLVAIGLRLGSALYQGNAVVELPGIFDQISYDALARRVLDGFGFSFATSWWPLTRAGEPTAHWSYLYTLYLVAVYAVADGQPVVARLVQAIAAGALQPWLTWRLASRIFGARAGLAAAGLAAVYPYFVYYAGALVTETFTILALLWALDLATGPVRASIEAGRPSSRLAGLRPWLLLGLALGLAALLRQVTLLFTPVLAGWLLWLAARPRAALPIPGRRARAVRVATGLACALGLVALLILPWTARNYQAFGRFLLLNTNAGFVFFWANHPIYGARFVGILPNGTYQALVPSELRGLDEAALESALLQRGLRFVLDDPGRYALLSLSRFEEYFKFWPSAESSPLSNVSRVLSFGLGLPLILLGLVLAIARGRQHLRAGQRPAVALLVLFAASYATVHLLSWALIRYRLPVDAVLLPFGGLGLVWLAGRLRRGLAYNAAFVNQSGR